MNLFIQTVYIKEESLLCRICSYSHTDPLGYLTNITFANEVLKSPLHREFPRAEVDKGHITPVIYSL